MSHHMMLLVYSICMLCVYIYIYMYLSYSRSSTGKICWSLEGHNLEADRSTSRSYRLPRFVGRSIFFGIRPTAQNQNSSARRGGQLEGSRDTTFKARLNSFRTLISEHVLNVLKHRDSLSTRSLLRLKRRPTNSTLGKSRSACRV